MVSKYEQLVQLPKLMMLGKSSPSADSSWTSRSLGSPASGVWMFPRWRLVKTVEGYGDRQKKWHWKLKRKAHLLCKVKMHCLDLLEDLECLCSCSHHGVILLCSHWICSSFCIISDWGLPYSLANLLHLNDRKLQLWQQENKQNRLFGQCTAVKALWRLYSK